MGDEKTTSSAAGAKAGSESGRRTDPIGFSKVYVAETERLFGTRRRRTVEPAGAEEPPTAGAGKLPAHEERIGLALSGGGIRSAAFSLGVLQALDARGVFERIDFLSTVSGGGYTGAALVAALHREPGRFPFSVEGTDRGPSAGAEAPAFGDVVDNQTVSRLRDRCRYLIPDGWFSIPVSLGIILRGLAVNVVTVAAFVFLLAAFTLSFNPTVAHLDRPAVEHSGLLTQAFGNRFVLTKLFVLALFVWLVVWGIWRSIGAAAKPTERSADPGTIRAWLTGYALVLLAIVFVTELQDPVLFQLRDFTLRSVDSGPGWNRFTALLGAVAAGTGVAGFFAKAVVGAVQSTLGEAGWAAFVKRISSALLLVALAAALPALIYLCYLWLVTVALLDCGVDKLPAFFVWMRSLWTPAVAWLVVALPLSAILVWLVRVGPHGLAVDREQWGDRDFRKQVSWAAGLFVVAAAYVVFVGWLIGVAVGPLPEWLQPHWTPETLTLVFVAALWLPAATTIWCLVVGVGRTRGAIGNRGDIEFRKDCGKAVLLIILVGLFIVRMALYSDYDRLDRTLLYRNSYMYLLVSIFLFSVVFLFSENANSLHHLYRDRLAHAFSIHGAGDKPLKISDLTERPYLIVNTAVNLQSSDSNTRERNADIFVFTRDHVGSKATRYISTKTFEAAEPAVDLATLVAVSGAAVSANMGRSGIALLTPTLALLNVRLGYWVRNPRILSELDGTVAEQRGADFRAVKSYRAASLQDWRLFYLAAEAFGLLGDDRSKVNLSDGGHVDNLGVTELMQRRCSVIIVSDAECDPGMVFTSLVDIQRFARIDQGVRIELDYEIIADEILARKALLGSRPAVPAARHAHAAIGTIHYPKATIDGSEYPEAKGILLYVKASVTGDEAAYVLDYEKRYSAFPQETTGDQFFSEEQFEAYRALGFHAMDRGLDGAVGDPDGTGPLAKLRAALGARESAPHDAGPPDGDGTPPGAGS